MHHEEARYHVRDWNKHAAVMENRMRTNNRQEVWNRHLKAKMQLPSGRTTLKHCVPALQVNNTLV